MVWFRFAALSVAITMFGCSGNTSGVVATRAVPPSDFDAAVDKADAGGPDAASPMPPRRSTFASSSSETVTPT